MIFYLNYFPAFKAGGPVQSIMNMVDLIKQDIIIDIICSAYDLGDREVLNGIRPDEWNERHENVKVLYLKKGGMVRVASVFRERKPDVVYVNGIFLPFYSWLPIMLAQANKCRIIISPRGMLQAGAMALGQRKKSLSIALLKLLRLNKDVIWLASDQQEKEDICLHFGHDATVQVIGNVPKPPLDCPAKPAKKKNELRLIYLSLITGKKNLLFLLDILKEIDQPVVLHIYGPIKDQEYWKKCVSRINGQIHSIEYCGPVNPGEVQNTMRKYDAFVLLTKGENFGHAIYEALSCGIPAIISQYTPWGRLQEFNAGLTVDINNADECREGIRKFLGIGEAESDLLSEGAFQLALEYYKTNNFKAEYISLFSGA